MVLLVVAVGTAGAMRPSIPKLPPVEGYNGCFDKKGALIRDLFLAIQQIRLKI